MASKGKPGSSPLLRPDGDAVSLHSAGPSFGDHRRHGLFDEADDDAPLLDVGETEDLPPLYSDVVGDDGRGGAADEAGSAAAATAATAAATAAIGGGDDDDDDDDGRVIVHDPSVAPGHGGPQKVRYAISPFRPGEATWMAGSVQAWAKNPPRAYVQLRGTHTETVERSSSSSGGGSKKETSTVTDFDVKVDLTPYLYADARNPRSAWRTLRTPDNRTRTCRGTVFPCQAPEVRGPPRLPPDEEARPTTTTEPTAANDDDGDDRPSLLEWCRRFCDDPAPLRSFELRRRVVGFDEDKVRRQLTALVRSTNYRGHLVVSFPTDETGLVYYSDHWLNRWRQLRWLQVLCALTLLLVFTWPYLFFRTKRYQVVDVDWTFSRLNARGRRVYVTISEDQWYNLWGRAIHRAVLGRRQGQLNQDDLARAEGAELTFESTGNSTVDGALGFVQAGITAMNHVNRQLGWGADC